MRKLIVTVLARRLGMVLVSRPRNKARGTQIVSLLVILRLLCWQRPPSISTLRYVWRTEVRV